MDSHHLDIAIRAAKAGARELMQRRGSHCVYEKAPKDLVTDADLASQKVIREILSAAFPTHAFVGEEEGETQPPADVRSGNPDAPPCWVVDPLDGTVNYVHHLQSFAVSIGLHVAGRMALGVVYDPVAEEMFTAIDGQAAYCNGHEIHASGCDEIGESLLACSFPAGVRGGDPEVERFIRVLEQCRSLRRLGSCALNLCYVAAGRLDGYWATNVCAWDSAAGSVIARAAGASISASDGGEMDDWIPRFCVAGSESLRKTMVALLAG
ncbi:MAG: inositol monophosphatase family protein [Planctomycetota bacterium]